MDNIYAQTVRLLLTAAPDVFDNDIFAMKGGTAINLFVQDMPRLSVDIDVAYLPWMTPRDEALQAIADELDAIARRLGKLDLRSRKIASQGLGDTKLIVEDDECQVKVEVNVVFRGTVLPPGRRSLCARTAAMFSAELELPVLAPDELYGSKLVAPWTANIPGTCSTYGICIGPAGCRPKRSSASSPILPATTDRFMRCFSATRKISRTNTTRALSA